MWKDNFDINNRHEYEANSDSNNYGELFSQYNNILIMLYDSTDTRHTNKLLHALIAGRWICQSYSLCSDVIIFTKIPIYKSFLKPAFFTFLMSDIMIGLWIREAEPLIWWYFSYDHSISDKVK
jgi:hypothetical protein